MGKCALPTTLWEFGIYDCGENLDGLSCIDDCKCDQKENGIIEIRRLRKRWEFAASQNSFIFKYEEPFWSLKINI